MSFLTGIFYVYGNISCLVNGNMFRRSIFGSEYTTQLYFRIWPKYFAFLGTYTELHSSVYGNISYLVNGNMFRRGIFGSVYTTVLFPYITQIFCISGAVYGVLFKRIRKHILPCKWERVLQLYIRIRIWYSFTSRSLPNILYFWYRIRSCIQSYTEKYPAL